MNQVSADWVLPVSGPPVRDGLVRFDDGLIVEVTTGRAERHLCRRGDHPWLRQRPLAPRVLRVCRVRRRRGLRAVAADAHAAEAGTRLRRDARDRPARSVGLPRLGHHHHRRLQLLGRRGQSSDRDRPARDRLPGGLRAETRGRRAPVHRETLGARRDRPRAHRRLATRAVHLLGRRLRVVPVARHPRGNASRRKRERERVARRRERPPNALASLLVPPTGKRAVGTLEQVLSPELLCAHCVDLQPDEIAPPRGAWRPGCALPALERAARMRDRAVARTARGRRHGRPRDGLAGLDAVIRHVR